MQPGGKRRRVQAGQNHTTGPLPQAGPPTTTSATGHLYLIVFVCRSYGHTHTYFLKKKPDASDVLDEFINNIK
jgi:hypothetical protein